MSCDDMQYILCRCWPRVDTRGHVHFAYWALRIAWPTKLVYLLLAVVLPCVIAVLSGNLLSPVGGSPAWEATLVGVAAFFLARVVVLEGPVRPPYIVMLGRLFAFPIGFVRVWVYRFKFFFCFLSCCGLSACIVATHGGHADGPLDHQGLRPCLWEAPNTALDPLLMQRFSTTDKTRALALVVQLSISVATMRGHNVGGQANAAKRVENGYEPVDPHPDKADGEG